jgi:hypothetical protein
MPINQPNNQHAHQPAKQPSHQLSNTMEQKIEFLKVKCDSQYNYHVIFSICYKLWL